MRACFTGHRPDKLIGKEEDVKNYISREIDRAVSEGITTFISGMCAGVDVIAGEVVVEKRKTNPDIHLIAAMPYPRFGFNWADGWGIRIQNLLRQADYIRNVSNTYTGRGVFQVRNEFMCNNSARLIAYFDGTPGGTKNTVMYARKIGMDIVYSHKLTATGR